jgi:hypothetical protein
MTSLDQLRTDLLARRGTWPAIKAHTGLSYSWISKFAHNKIPSPRVISIDKLMAALEATRQ